MMHHALEIQEILLNILGYCRLPSRESAASDLPALARTCRAFKEPALDVLWKELANPSPLAQCLPEASRHSEIPYLGGERYSFSRSLTRIEWGILRSYTTRIRSLDEIDTFDWESVSTFLTPPATEPLFPNLRHLEVSGLTEIKIKHLLYMPFPSLISLDVWSIQNETLYSFQNFLESFSVSCPNIKRLSISLNQPVIMFSKFFSSYICRWRDLHTVDCGRITLNEEALVHLSRMTALTRLSCMPSATFPLSHPLLFFTNLRYLNLLSESLNSISVLLSRTRLPAITAFTASIRGHRSKRRFPSFLASIQTAATGHTIQELRFEEGSLRQDGVETEDSTPILGFEDLQPCTAFSNLRRIDLDVLWEVDLSDRELLTLASAWPHLEHLVINAKWGWNTLGGITPNGLLQLLQTCRSLNEVGVAIDTRGYTEFRESSAILGPRLPPMFCINVIDSLIDEESVPAVAAFFVGLGAPGPNFSFYAYDSPRLIRQGTADENRWGDVYRLVYALGQRSGTS